MERIGKSILFILLGTKYIDAANPSGNRTECRMYSRTTASWVTWDCGEQNDYANGEVSQGGILEYGHTYKGLGDISTPEECARACEEGASPKNCYYKFTIELYHTLGSACNSCHPTTNTSLSSDCECVLADGVPVSGIPMINRMLPGPSIQVCIGDLVIVDAVNEISDSALTIHWHGLSQIGWQYYDGAPFVTECPIPFKSSFRYNFRAQNAGTHFYEGDTGLHRPNGLQGAVIIRTPPKYETNSNLYDIDGPDTIIMLTDWMHSVPQNPLPGTNILHLDQNPDNILINGRGLDFNTTTNISTEGRVAVFNVRSGLRYRFRLIGGSTLVRGIRIRMQNHSLIFMTAPDAVDVMPVVILDSLSLSAGERFDFVINTTQPVGEYWIIAQRDGDDSGGAMMQQVAVLRYNGATPANGVINTPVPSELDLPLGITLNPTTQICDGNSTAICVQDLQSADAVNPKISAKTADINIYLPINFHNLTAQELLVRNTSKNSQAADTTTNYAFTFSNISNVFPSSPYLSQFNDIPAGTTCNYDNKPKACSSSELCYCSHLSPSIPLNTPVEIVVADEANIGLNYSCHLHGYGFHLMAQGNMSLVNITRENKDEALQLHQNEYGPLNPRPPVKDTISIASNSYMIIRFIADNPGYWLFQCHFRPYQLSGMEITLHVGEQKDLPPVPPGFSKCGNLLPTP